MSKPKGELFSILSKILVLENILKDLSDSSNKRKKNAIEKRVNEILKIFITNNFRVYKFREFAFKNLHN